MVSLPFLVLYFMAKTLSAPFSRVFTLLRCYFTLFRYKPGTQGAESVFPFFLAVPDLVGPLLPFRFFPDGRFLFFRAGIERIFDVHTVKAPLWEAGPTEAFPFKGDEVLEQAVFVVDPPVVVERPVLGAYEFPYRFIRFRVFKEPVQALQEIFLRDARIGVPFFKKFAFSFNNVFLPSIDFCHLFSPF